MHITRRTHAEQDTEGANTYVTRVKRRQAVEEVGAESARRGREGGASRDGGSGD